MSSSRPLLENLCRYFVLEVHILELPEATLAEEVWSGTISHVLCLSVAIEVDGWVIDLTALARKQHSTVLQQKENRGPSPALIRVQRALADHSCGLGVEYLFACFDHLAAHETQTCGYLGRIHLIDRELDLSRKNRRDDIKFINCSMHY